MKDIPLSYHLEHVKKPKDAIKDHRMFHLSWLVLGILLIGYFIGEQIHIPVLIIASIIAFFFLLMARRSPVVNTKQVLKGNW
ncbi:Na+/H+ antiporter NhaD/arsenite permease-like protein [Bacillus alveayuensis]|uniref:Na+/H+ antiporter NhaD/arsenite permease-like protein n=1 Tax=Aeribacillus alveayuensis TaxID=279215 RepID=A0ABT9VPQ8_9BACI|nr:Na+/H+ antiporter NhaD/arsenite permease-like protein [Bacillus alveayuensis]